MIKKRVQNPSAKREAILAAATHLFGENGYEATSIAHIAETANVAVGSVYRQFPDKVAILAALHRDLESVLVIAMRDAWDCDLPYPDRFEPSFSALFAAINHAHAMMPIMAMSKELIGKDDYAPGAAMIAAVEAMYFEGVAAGALRAYPRDVLPAILYGMVNGAISAWMAKPAVLKDSDIVATLATLARTISRI